MNTSTLKVIFTLSLLPFFIQIGFTQTHTISLENKLLAASKFWQEVNYNFVFLDKVNKKQWDSLYQQTLMQIMDTKNDYAYFRLMEKLCAFLKDGHTNVYYPENVAKNVMITNFGEYRLFVSNIENKAIISRVNASKKAEIPIGSEILSVNGIETQAYLNRFVKPYISSSTDYVLHNQSTYELLKGYEGDKFIITLKTPQNKVITLRLKHAITTEKEVFPPFKNRSLIDYQTLENDIHYLALNSFEDEKMDSAFIAILPNLYKAKAVILDLRYNGGGNTVIGFNILQYFTQDTLLYGSKSITRQHIPTYKAWGAYLTPQDTLQDMPEWDMSKAEITQSYLMAQDAYYYTFPYQPSISKIKDKRINAPVVVLIGNGTASAAEDFLIYADPLPHFTFIGDKSFGSTGQPYMFDLPGGGKARICTKKDIYPDGKEFVGYGISPDIFIPYTLSDYLDDKDPVLQAALQFLNKNK